MIQSQRDISIAPYTHYKIGGTASEVYFPESTSDVLELVQILRKSNTDYFILGGGTNVLVGDGYWDGAVMITTNMDHSEALGNKLICGAGMASSRAAEIALENAKTGLEFLYRLPGSIGGALAGNARFDNTNISDTIFSFLAVHPDHGMKRFRAHEIDFSYKQNCIVNEGWIICELTLAWKNGDSGKIKTRMDDIERFRNDNHHFDYPSCGCVFKNDHKKNIQAGRLLDSLGLKGLKRGDAQVAPFHANFIINTGSSTARDVRELIEQVEGIVIEKTGIRLEREVKFYGTF